MGAGIDEPQYRPINGELAVSPFLTCKGGIHANGSKQ
jgi:hypothetical protein